MRASRDTCSAQEYWRCSCYRLGTHHDRIVVDLSSHIPICCTSEQAICVLQRQSEGQPLEPTCLLWLKPERLKNCSATTCTHKVPGGLLLGTPQACAAHLQESSLLQAAKWHHTKL